MNNIKQALASAIEVIHKNTHLRDKEATDAINACKAALAELDKCEPVAWIDPADGALYHYKMYDTYKPLYTSLHPRDWVELSDNFIAETIWENTKLNPNIKDDAETLLYVTNAVKAILAESKQLNTKG